MQNRGNGHSHCVQLLAASDALARALGRLRFDPPVTHVYNPLFYARQPYETYVRKFVHGPVRVMFLGMNPGPFGMVQTGVPFGEIAAVRDWLGIAGSVSAPKVQHPRRPIHGFDCPRSEISGQRLWGLFARRFRDCDHFFQEHLVMNYCPLAFMEETGRNRTPDKLRPSEREAVYAACDAHLRNVVKVLQPEWVIGIGDFALKRAQEALGESGPRLGRILHPSPANPAANRNWAELATRQLEALGVWPATKQCER